MPENPERLELSFIEEEKYSNWFSIDMSIYHCKFNKDVYDDKLFDQLGIYFPQSLRKAVGKRRSEFLAGRYCAEKSLQKLGIYNKEIAIGEDRCPQWPSDVVGSISHCGTYAVAITGYLSNTNGVGIDIEEETNESTIEKIQSQILSEEEISLVSKNTTDIPFLFTLAFSVKESFFKAAYPLVGQYFDFDAISVLEINQEMRTITLRINYTLHEKLLKDMMLTGTFHSLPGKQVVTLIVLK